MCGLVGVAGDLYGQDVQFFREALYADGLRGFHSTGAALVATGKHGYTALHKKVGSPLHLLGEQQFQRDLSPSKSVLLGHNRHATVGEHSVANAHPFRHGTIVGAHNGTLSPGWQRKLPDSDKFGTDSETLYNAIAHYGLEDAIGSVEGAWALTWYDRANNTINFLRNEERPLFYCFSANGKALYWASESYMLRWLLDRNHIDRGEVFKLNPDKHVSYTVPNTGQTFGEPRVVEVKGYERPPFVWQGAKDPYTGGPAAVGPGATSQVTQQPANASPKKSESESASKKKEGQLVLLPSTASTGTKKPVNSGPVNLHSINNRVPENVMTIPEYTKHLDAAFDAGIVAGERGWSKSRCPYTPRSAAAEQWQQGRLLGLEPKKGKDAAEIIDSDRGARVRGYSSEWLTQEEFDERTKGVCAWGGCNVEFTDKVHWADRDTCVCDDCANQTDVQQFLDLEVKSA